MLFIVVAKFSRTPMCISLLFFLFFIGYSQWITDPDRTKDILTHSGYRGILDRWLSTFVEGRIQDLNLAEFTIPVTTMYRKRGRTRGTRGVRARSSSTFVAPGPSNNKAPVNTRDDPVDISDTEKVPSEKAITVGSSSDDNAVEIQNVQEDSATSTGTTGTDKDDGDDYEHEDSGDFNDNEDDDNESGSQKKRQKRIVPYPFTLEQEMELADWFRGHELLYNKKLREFKNASKKKRLYEEKAATFDPPCSCEYCIKKNLAVHVKLRYVHNHLQSYKTVFTNASPCITLYHLVILFE